MNKNECRNLDAFDTYGGFSYEFHESRPKALSSYFNTSVKLPSLGPAISISFFPPTLHLAGEKERERGRRGATPQQHHREEEETEQ